MANLQIPNLSNPSMDIWPAPQAQQGGWAIPSPGGAIGGAAQKINPSPKRPYGQVQRIAEDQWRCPDGQTFPRAYLAYRHLKELKEKNPTLLSPYKSPRTSDCPERASTWLTLVQALQSVERCSKEHLWGRQRRMDTVRMR